MDRYEVARRLRRLEGLARLPLIAFSGHGQSWDENRSREVGFDAHLTKPADLHRLRDLLAD